MCPLPVQVVFDRDKRRVLYQCLVPLTSTWRWSLTLSAFICESTHFGFSSSRRGGGADGHVKDATTVVGVEVGPCLVPKSENFSVL